ncbi:MAG TPA: heavy metal-associated domain-containing protein [Bacteriovoracaceae bacterium]|nr:heavy metal-associated domain-containing protein [Bacteriovoracaceae bacterium]
MKFSTLLVTLLVSSGAFAAQVEVDINGMSCGMCAEAITRELNETNKIENVVVSFSEKKARFEDIKFQPDPETKIKEKAITDYEIRSAIKRAGYDAGKIVHKK